MTESTNPLERHSEQLAALEVLYTDYQEMKKKIAHSPLSLEDVDISLHNLTGQLVCLPWFPSQSALIYSTLSGFYWRRKTLESLLWRVLRPFRLSTTVIVTEPISPPIIFLSTIILYLNVSANGSGW